MKVKRGATFEAVMEEKLILLIVGGLVGFLSGISTVLLNNYLIDRREKRKSQEKTVEDDRAQDIRMLEDRKARLITDMNEIAKYSREIQSAELRRKDSFKAMRTGDRIQEVGLARSVISDDSLVLMRSGICKLSSEIEVGDEILTFNSKNERNIADTVVFVERAEIHGIVTLNDALKVPKGQILVVGRGGGKDATSLQLGDRLALEDGQYLEVSSIAFQSEPVKVTQFRLRGGETISVDGRLVALSKTVPKEEFYDQFEIAVKSLGV